MVTIDMIPSVTEAVVGQSVVVQVLADLSEPVIGFGFDFVFDPTLLRLDSVTIPQPFVSLVGSRQSGGVLAMAYPNNAQGTASLLASARFTTLSPGLAVVGIVADPGDKTQGFPELQVGEYSTVTVRTAGIRIVVPEPSTVLFLAVGILAMFWLPYHRATGRS